MCVLIFSRNLSETFLILRKNQPDIIINVHRSSCKVPLSSLDFNEALIFSTDFRKIVKTFHKNPYSLSRVVLCGRTDVQGDGQTCGETDRHDEANSRFSQLYEGA
jgi:hypothetical protein